MDCHQEVMVALSVSVMKSTQVQIPAVTLFRSVISLSNLFTHNYSNQLKVNRPFVVDKLAPAETEGQSPFVHLWANDYVALP